MSLAPKTATDRRNTIGDGDSDAKPRCKPEQRAPTYWQCQICMTTLESAEVYEHFKNHTDEEIEAFKPKETKHGSRRTKAQSA